MIKKDNVFINGNTFLLLILVICYVYVFFFFSIKACIQFIKDETKSPTFDKDGKINNLAYFINALISQGIHGPFKKENVIVALQELIALHNDIPSVILDVLNISDAETAILDSQNDECKERNNFCYIVKECEKVNKSFTLDNKIYIPCTM